MKQLTVSGFDDDLAEAIRQLARRDGTSLNQAALKLLRRGRACLTGATGNICPRRPSNSRVTTAETSAQQLLLLRCGRRPVRLVEPG